MTEQEPRCETCRFWDGRIIGLTHIPGECRRYPPQITARPGQAMQEWPSTIYRDWCGEHQPKGPTT